MFITEKLKQLADEFLTELQTAEKNAKTEAQFDELETICEDLILGIPITILQKDYFMRSALRTWMDDYFTDEEKRTKYISRVMTGLYNLDTIHFDEYIGQVIEDDVANIEKDINAIDRYIEHTQKQEA